MELEGLHRVLEFLTKKDLQVGTLVTDMHQQINKWMREEHSKSSTILTFGMLLKVSACTLVTIPLYLCLCILFTDL